MTSVAINRVGSDQTTLELLQTGSSETSVSLRHYLLDDTLSYMFSVSALSVPLNRAPINPVQVATELFRVRRRNVGTIVETNMDLAGGFPIFMIQPNQFFDVSALVRAIANWARGFNKAMSLLGLDDLRPYGGDFNADDEEDAEVEPLDALVALDEDDIHPETGDVPGGYPFLNIKLSSDGVLQIVGTNHFWNNFVIRFSKYGAALLGFADTLDGDYLLYTQDLLTDVPELGNWVDATGMIVDGDLLSEVVAKARHPVYQSADQRVKISVESHLPMISNLSIVDQVETVDRTICDKYFENKLETSIRFDDTGTYKESTMKTKLYSGQVAFIKKSDRHTEWLKLLTAYELRYFRFHLFITYRTWDNTNNRFKLTKKLLEVPENKYWDMTIKFVSEV